VNASDLLKQARGSGYGAGPKSEGETGPRSFPITPEESESLQGCSCVKAYGKPDGDKYVIDRIEPEQGALNEDAIMVRNATQVSPS
jgi:hypothetical protein